MKSTAELLNTYFDRIYVINLERASDRRAHMNKIFKDVDFEYLVATDKSGIHYDQALKEGLIAERNMKELSRHPKKLSEAEIACAISHRRIFEDMLEKGYQRILIFEDDITRMPEPRNLEQALAELPEKWDVFLLGHENVKMLNFKRKIDQIIYKIFRAFNLYNWRRRSLHYINHRYTIPYSTHLLKMGEFYGVHAYALSVSGAKKLLAHQQPINHTADGLVNYINLQEGKLDMYGIQPALFNQESLRQTGMFDSYISGN